MATPRSRAGRSLAALVALVAVGAASVAQAHVDCEVSDAGVAPGDSDGDTVCDDEDNCQFVPNPLQRDGDGDLVGDQCDRCLGDDVVGDSDGDGACDDFDCAPRDPRRTPGADEVCDGVDNDCDDVLPEGEGDNDADSVLDCADRCVGDDASGDSDVDGVCDDVDVCVGDNATGDVDGDRVCDNLDVCDGDDAAGDGDGDGVCDDTDVCLGDDARGDLDGDDVCDDLDCWPRDPLAWPRAPERCNGRDDDCNGATDNGADEACGPGERCVRGGCTPQQACFVDADGDGFGGAATATLHAPGFVCADAGRVARGDDCDDDETRCGAACSPAAEEGCDGSDNDCDGGVDEGAAETCAAVANGVALCDDGACEPRCDAGYAAADAACVDVNECDAPSPCGPHALCVNVDGGFRCDCAPGYRDDAGPCAPVCGDGLVVTGEDCDDANGAAGNGCDACRVEAGWSCAGAPSVCVRRAVCGDGVVAGDEGCDDGGLFDGDGCSRRCAVEDGARCETGADGASVCRTAGDDVGSGDTGVDAGVPDAPGDAGVDARGGGDRGSGGCASAPSRRSPGPGSLAAWVAGIVALVAVRRRRAKADPADLEAARPRRCAAPTRRLRALGASSRQGLARRAAPAWRAVCG